MDVYSRYPNRKKPLAGMPSLGFNVDESDAKNPGDEPAGADPQDSSAERDAVEKLRPSSYKVIEPEPEPEPERLVNIAATPEPQPPSVKVDAKKENSTGEPPTPRIPFSELWMERIRKFAESQTRVYAAAGVGMGILLGVVIAGIFWLTGNPGPYDLGTATSSVAGLKGHLYAKWDKKLEYRLTIEPSSQDQQAGFALAVARSPRPLSIQIHLQDSQGFQLCSGEILLKYDARNALPVDASNTETPAGKMDADSLSGDLPAQIIKDADSAAQEVTREQGKDVFQNQAGANGQIAAISAEGEIPCSRRAYRNIVSWSFLPVFPSVAEQGELLAQQKEEQDRAARLAEEELAAHRNKTHKSAIQLLPFSIEGDDSIVEFDSSSGVIETRGDKIFYFSPSSGQVTDPRWQDYPVSIHYKCDRATNCALTHEGLGGLRARMKR